MRTTKLAILALLSLIPLLLSGCGSSRDSGGDQTVGLTPTETIAAASFVGSTQCLSCHSNKSNWGHTLHKAVLRAPNAFSAAQANTETFYAGTVNKGIKLSLGTADGGLNDAVTPDGEFVAYYYSTIDDKWKTHYELGQGAAPSTAALTTPSGNYALKYTAQVVKSGSEYFILYTNLVNAETAQYKILFSYGGEKNYKQRYVLTADNNNTGKLLGASKHISPLQYNDKWSGYVDPTSPATPDLNYKWVNYHGERWYNTSSDALTSPGSKDSFDGNCAGCHFTGYQIAKNGGGEEIADAVNDINGAVDFDGDGNMDEINIGCEACHGAGGEHAATQNPAFIINPANLAPAEANMVCGQCHIRGKSVDTFTDHFAEASSSSAVTAPFPAKRAADGTVMKFRPGLDDLAEFYSFDSGTGTFDGQYWGGEPSSGNYQASSSHHQQYIDMLQGPHAPDKSYDPKCFDCHDMHNNASTGRHQIVTTITEDNVVVKTANDDNSLCLACHAGLEPFAAVTVEDVAQVSTNSAFNVLMDPVKEAVAAHTQHYYDPAKQDSASNGSSRCSRCHMPKTAKSALKYDIHAHSFEVIEPAASLSTAPAAGVPNGCTSCHDGSSDAKLNALQTAFDAKFPKGTDGHLDVTLRAATLEFSQWETSGHAHYAGDPFNHWNEDGEIPTSCAKCHSKDGFVDFAVDGTVDAAAKLGTVLSCGTCHINGDSPDLHDVSAQTLFDDPATYPEVANVTFPSGATRSKGDASNICMNCHQGRESGASITAVTPVGNETGLDFINRHYFAAAAINFGTDVNAGYEYAGQTYVGEMTFPGHQAEGVPLLINCVGCHLREGTDDHTFEPDIVRCGQCHFDSLGAAITDFKELGIPEGDPNIDYDGDGTGESFQAEIDGLEASLLNAIQTYADTTLGAPIIYQAGAYPYFFKDTNSNGLVDDGEAIFPNRYTAFDATLLRAAFNYHSAQDPCGNIHNHKYVIQTIFDSADDLDDGLLNGSATGTRP